MGADEFVDEFVICISKLEWAKTIYIRQQV